MAALSRRPVRPTDRNAVQCSLARLIASDRMPTKTRLKAQVASKWWNSSPLLGIVTVWTIWLNVGEPGFTSITASASGFEKSGLSSKV